MGYGTYDHVGADGFRLDAIKLIASDFFIDWISDLEQHSGRDLFVVGEYWSYDLQALHWYPANSCGQYDMRRLLEGTLMQQLPLLALESVVEPWFKPLTYAVILLPHQGYPCIFHADGYGAHYSDTKDDRRHEIWLASHGFLIDRFLLARAHCTYGPQYDDLDHFNTIGWTRLDTPGQPRAKAVPMSDGAPDTKWMEVGKRNTVFRDLTGHLRKPITTNGDGWTEWRCPGGSVSVRVEEPALAKMGVTL